MIHMHVWCVWKLYNHTHTHTHINEEGEAKLAARKQPKRVHEVKL